MNKDTFFERLDVPLTQDEVRQRGEDLAKAILQRNIIRDEKKAANGRFKERLDEAEARIEELRRNVSMKKEARDVECREVFGGSSIVEVIRLDGHDPKTVRTRGMTEAEIKDQRQGKLFLLEGQKPKPKSAAEKAAAKAESSKLEADPAAPKTDDNGITREPMKTNLGEAMKAAEEKKADPAAPAEIDEPAAPAQDAEAAGKALEGAMAEIEGEASVPPERSADPKTGQELVKVDRKRKAGAKLRAVPPAGGAAAAAEEAEGDGSLV